MANNTIVGVDIGSTHIRAIQTTPGRNKIEKYGEIPLEPNTVSNGIIKDPTAITQALTQLWKKAGFNTKNVRLGMGGEPTVSSRITAEDLSDEDFAKALPFIFSEKTVYNRDDYYLDYHTLSRFTQKEIDEDGEPYTAHLRTALVCGGKRDDTATIIKAAKDAKLKPVSIDLNSLALLRAYDPKTLTDNYDSANISIDIGGTVITLVVHKNNQPLFIRDMTGEAGNNITHNILKDLKIKTWEKAEERKIEALYTDITPNLDNTPTPDLTPAKIDRVTLAQPIIAAGRTAIISQIIETLQWFFTRSDEGQDLKTPTGLYLSGGAATTPGIADTLAATFKTEIEYAQPFTNSGHKNPPANQHAYTIAYGIATGEGASHG